MRSNNEPLLLREDRPGGTATLTFDRPAQINALSVDMLLTGDFIDAAYQLAVESMVCNVMSEDAALGIAWPGRSRSGRIADTTRQSPRENPDTQRYS